MHNDPSASNQSPHHHLVVRMLNVTEDKIPLRTPPLLCTLSSPERGVVQYGTVPPSRQGRHQPLRPVDCHNAESSHMTFAPC